MSEAPKTHASSTIYARLSFGTGRGPGVGWLVHVLARPAHRDDRLAYVASQYVAENLKALGVDGIIYRSSFNPILGRNLALFDPKAAAPVGTELHQVMTVSITSRERLLGSDSAAEELEG